MARRKRKDVEPSEVRGRKYFDNIAPLLERLRSVGTRRDRAGNRLLFYDDLVALLLFYFFNPVVTSLRSLQQASQLDKVRRFLGVGRSSLGSLSESTGVFDPEPLREIVRELAGRALPLQHGPDSEALRNLVAVDGSVLRAVPRMAWALWKDDRHRAAKLHLHFDVLKGVPEDATVTTGKGSEKKELLDSLKADRLYVADRGYVSYSLFRSILDAGSSFIVRVKDNTAFTVERELPIGPEAARAGVVRDVLVGKLGTDHHRDHLKRPVRLVVVRCTGRDREVKETWLVTDRLDMPAELVSLGYKHRWTVELFFRWFKCVLGVRHLLFEDEAGVEIQVYVALIASLLIVLWTDRKPTRRTWEMIQFYLAGWASLDELMAHLERLPEKRAAKKS